MAGGGVINGFGYKGYDYKKMLDAQEMVRDFEMFSKQTYDERVASMFKIFAKESGMQAREPERLADHYKEN